MLLWLLLWLMLLLLLSSCWQLPLLWLSLSLSKRLEAFGKADSTRRSSQAVPHPSTNRALRCLTSEVGRVPAYSTRYGRQQRTPANEATHSKQGQRQRQQQRSSPEGFMVSSCLRARLQRPPMWGSSPQPYAYEVHAPPTDLWMPVDNWPRCVQPGQPHQPEQQPQQLVFSVASKLGRSTWRWVKYGERSYNSCTGKQRTISFNESGKSVHRIPVVQQPTRINQTCATSKHHKHVDLNDSSAASTTAATTSNHKDNAANTPTTPTAATTTCCCCCCCCRGWCYCCCCC